MYGGMFRTEDVMGCFKNFAIFGGCLGVTLSFGATYEPPATAVSKINSYRGYSELTDAAKGRSYLNGLVVFPIIFNLQL